MAHIQILATFTIIHKSNSMIFNLEMVQRKEKGLSSSLGLSSEMTSHEPSSVAKLAQVLVRV